MSYTFSVICVGNYLVSTWCSWIRLVSFTFTGVCTHTHSFCFAVYLFLTEDICLQLSLIIFIHSPDIYGYKQDKYSPSALFQWFCTRWQYYHTTSRERICLSSYILFQIQPCRVGPCRWKCVQRMAQKIKKWMTLGRMPITPETLEGPLWAQSSQSTRLATLTHPNIW